MAIKKMGRDSSAHTRAPTQTLDFSTSDAVCDVPAEEKQSTYGTIKIGVQL